MKVVFMLVAKKKARSNEVPKKLRYKKREKQVRYKLSCRPLVGLSVC